MLNIGVARGRPGSLATPPKGVEKIYDGPQTSSRLGRGHPLPVLYPFDLGAFGASVVNSPPNKNSWLYAYHCESPFQH